MTLDPVLVIDAAAVVAAAVAVDVAADQFSMPFE
eukprot:CAMPEP_0201725700 /NCGR_PEP_ID=MMETSP0593-20130828/9021_1 /ASSEMBLY_ACC=CAM_ASM_000672 /TAXON_ID=267983 /ORGANISM="Skeletonema japonicum, Strain CCMP2506" /LENGTH=33 /DNA_ID= /DNA_START= /DNA_END= /DNA_ORIENTATION=